MTSSSVPEFYNDFTTFSGDTSSLFNGSSSCPDVGSALSSYFDGSFNTSSNPESVFLSQVFGISDISVPQYNNYYQKMSVNNATQYLNGGDQEYYGFSPEIKPLFRPATGEQYWGNSEGGIKTDQPQQNTKVERYSVEERKGRIMRYLKKKNHRNFNKTIKYVCRKTLADRRVRVRGRFARNNDTCEEQHTPRSKNDHKKNSEKEEDLFSGSDDYLFQMEHDDGWLHEAMSNLIPLPCEFDAPEAAHHPNNWSF